MSKVLHIVGAGLAGSEAAWQAANAGVDVILHEMRPLVETPAHKTDHCAELVCSNSFRSDDKLHNAVGLLHEELRLSHSLILQEADKASVPAGGALAVDRDLFSGNVTKALMKHPQIRISRGIIDDIPPLDWHNVIIATGPLTAKGLALGIQKLTGENELAFFDAIAPIVYAESINLDRAWYQSRYDKQGPSGTGKDYINCPLNQEEYGSFVQALLEAEYGDFKEWEKDTPYFEGCMPVEVMASRGINTLRFGPMKPVGLTDPHTGQRPHAVVQLRQDNLMATLYNIVGFQTKMKYADQVRVLRLIPGLENAEFARLGGLHRNTFINSPKLLDRTLRLKAQQRLRFAGQITGCEGYVESAAVGLMAGIFAACEILNRDIILPEKTTAMGALLSHITGDANIDTFQPMNINFGLFPDLSEDFIAQHSAQTKKKKLKGLDKKKLLSQRALMEINKWVKFLNTLKT